MNIAALGLNAVAMLALYYFGEPLPRPQQPRAAPWVSHAAAGLHAPAAAACDQLPRLPSHTLPSQAASAGRGKSSRRSSSTAAPACCWRCRWARRTPCALRAALPASQHAPPPAAELPGWAAKHVQQRPRPAAAPARSNCSAPTPTTSSGTSSSASAPCWCAMRSARASTTPVGGAAAGAAPSGSAC
jgi:hypothetical protein